MFCNQDENQIVNEDAEVKDQKALEPTEAQQVEVSPQSKYTYKYGYGYYEPQPIRFKQPAITYIFVTSLIMMIILAFRSLNIFYIPNYGEALDYLVTTGQPQNIIDGFKSIMYLVYFSIFALLSCSICSLLLLIYSAKARNRENSHQLRVKFAKIIKIVAIIYLVSLCLHLILEFAAYTATLTFLEMTNIISFDVLKMELSLRDSFVLLGTFIGLQIAGIVKSRTYSSYINSITQ